jgi:glycerophosphoryl diester phosphodiesterase
MATGELHPFLAQPTPLSFAHRGGDEVAPENSLSAFQAATDIGFRILETDVHLSADGAVVATHDEDLMRVAGHPGRISELTLDEIRAVRVGGTEPIPLLEELLGHFPSSFFNIDPKSDQVVQPLISILRRHDAMDRVCIGTFSDERIARIRAEFGSAVCTAAGPAETRRFLIRSRAPGAARRARTGSVPFQCLQIPPRHRSVALVTPGLLRLAQKSAVQVHVWTVNEEAEMVRLLDLGVDGLMTDRPSVLKGVLEARGQWKA